MSEPRRLPIRRRLGLASIVALLGSAALGIGCGGGSSPGDTTIETSTQKEQQHPKHPPRVPSEGDTTTVEPAP